MIEGIQEWGQFGTQYSGHYEGERQDDGCEIDSEARMVEEGVEHDAYAFSTTDKTEAIERLYKEHICVPWKTNSQINEDGEEEARRYFKGDFKY